VILKYLRYVIRHKYFVFREGRKLRVPLWQLIVHDLSKFRPDEFFPYADYFYGGPHKSISEMHGDVRNHLWQWSKEGVESRFNVAWLKHIHRNPHHHQHWVLKNDDGTTEALPMPRNFLLEMIADWRGAGMAQGKPDTLRWYNDNKDKMILHPATRRRVGELLGVNS